MTIYVCTERDAVEKCGTERVLTQFLKLPSIVRSEKWGEIKKAGEKHQKSIYNTITVSQNTPFKNSIIRKQIVLTHFKFDNTNETNRRIRRQH